MDLYAVNPAAVRTAPSQPKTDVLLYPTPGARNHLELLSAASLTSRRVDSVVLNPVTGLVQVYSAVDRSTCAHGVVGFEWEQPLGILLPSAYIVTPPYGPPFEVNSPRFGFRGPLHRVINGTFRVAPVTELGVGPSVSAVANVPGTNIFKVSNIRPPPPSDVNGGYSFAEDPDPWSIGGTAYDNPTWKQIARLGQAQGYYALGVNVVDADGVNRQAEHNGIVAGAGSCAMWASGDDEYFVMRNMVRVSLNMGTRSPRNRCILHFQEADDSPYVPEGSTVSLNADGGPTDGTAYIIAINPPYG